MRQVLFEGRALPIFPCRRKGTKKPPTCPRGFKAATSDPAEIEQLFRLHPGTMVGVPAGKASGLVFVDADYRRSGDMWYYANSHRLPRTRIHETPSGGLHILFKYTPEFRNTADDLASGVETLSDGKYAIWHPANFCRVPCDAPAAEV